jgi:REP element-mobilizing transposase RayT
VHVVLRVIGAVGNLRRRFTYRAIREATLTTARREDFRIVHVSIQRTHVHLLVEADDKKALASGMQGFQISAAKHLNAAISKGKPGPRRRGAVFPDRYHAEAITSPTQARHALSYVLTNASHCTPWEKRWAWPTTSCQTWLLRSTIRRFYRDDPRLENVVLDRPPRRAFPNGIDLYIGDGSGVPQDLRLQRRSRHIDRSNADVFDEPAQQELAVTVGR